MSQIVRAHLSVFLVLVSTLLFMQFFVPFAHAQEGGLVTCSGPNECGTCEFVDTLENVFHWLVSLATIAATIFIVIAGVKLATSGGDADAREFAKKVLTNISIGFLLVLASFAIVNTIIQVLVPTGSPILSWNRVQCIHATPPQQGLNIENIQLTMGHDPLLPGAGTCTLGPQDSACDPSRLRQYFGSDANQMSGICMRESGGQPVVSQVDRCCGTDGDCTNADSFSGGYFQINILTGYQYIPGCSGGFYTNNGGSTPLGDCVQHSNGVCSGWSCSITNRSMYNTCMRAVRESSTNYETASRLFNAAEQAWGNGFRPWTTAGGGACQNLVSL